MWRNRDLEQSFPRLTEGNYLITSEPSNAYNCVAWALGDTSRFWYDVKIKGYYWPPGVGSADTIEGWKHVFAIHGYHETDSAEFDPAFEKIAIYVDAEGVPNHVARQTDARTWTSKLGKDYDIEHQTLEALECDEYGRATVIMQRRIKDGKRVKRRP